eukprot:1203220-Rhodomonas_salina.2
MSKIQTSPRDRTAPTEVRTRPRRENVSGERQPEPRHHRLPGSVPTKAHRDNALSAEQNARMRCLVVCCCGHTGPAPLTSETSAPSALTRHAALGACACACARQ